MSFRPMMSCLMDSISWMLHTAVLSDGKKMTAYLITMVVIPPCPCQVEVDPRELFPLSFLSCESVSREAVLRA